MGGVNQEPMVNLPKYLQICNSNYKMLFTDPVNKYFEIVISLIINDEC